MVRFAKAALVLSLVVIICQSAFAQGPTTALVGYLKTTEGIAKWSSVISNPEKLARIQNFIRGSGVQQVKIADALRATGVERAAKFRTLMEEAVTRAASDPALGARVVKVAQELVGATDAELTKVSTLQLQNGNPNAIRGSLIRNGGSGAIDFGTMPGGKYGPAMPTGPVANVPAEAIPALVEKLASLEQSEGRRLPDGFVDAVKDPEVVGEGMFDACLYGPDGKPLEAPPREVLELMIASRARVPSNVANLDLAVTEAAIEVGMIKTHRDRVEQIDAVDTLANQCGFLGARYSRGIALIRAGM